MKKKRRKQTAARYGHMFGVELFEDSRLLRVLMCQLHYDAVDAPSDAPPFPLADVDNPTATNANIVLYLIQPHHNDDHITIVHHHRYFHRDSQDPSDGLDLKRTYVGTGPIKDIEGVVLSFCRFVATDDHFALCAPPAVYDFSKVSIDVAIDELTQLPWVHTRVAVQDAGIQ